MGKLNFKIITDASHSHIHHIGSYAFCIICEKGEILGSGISELKLTCSSEAEMQAINTSVKTLLSYFHPSHIQSINIYTDSQLAIKILSNEKMRRNKDRYNAFSVALNDILYNKSYNDDIFLHKTKSRSKLTDKISKTHRWCDLEARKQLRLAVKNIENEISIQIPQPKQAGKILQGTSEHY